MLDIEKMEKNESLLFDEVSIKISKFNKGIKRRIFKDSYEKREFNSLSYAIEELNKYLEVLRVYIHSRFSYHDTEGNKIFDKYSNDFLKRTKALTDRYNKASELANLKVTYEQGMRDYTAVSKEIEALLNEMKVYYNELVDQFGVKYEYVGDGTKEKKGDIILKNGNVFGAEEISYKGITYSADGKIMESLPNGEKVFFVYNSEEQTIEYKKGNEYSNPILRLNVEIKDGEFFIDTIMTSLTKWLKSIEYYKKFPSDFRSKQYNEIENLLNNLSNFKEMLTNDFMQYRLVTKNTELEKQNEQIEPLQSAVETKKSENEQLNSEIVKKDEQITEKTDEINKKDEKISGLETRVADLEENQRFLFSTLKEIANQVDAVTTKPLVFSSDLKKLQGYTEASMSATQLQGIEESKKM